jgi:hypothetical protein
MRVRNTFDMTTKIFLLCKTEVAGSVAAAVNVFRGKTFKKFVQVQLLCDVLFNCRKKELTFPLATRRHSVHMVSGFQSSMHANEFSQVAVDTPVVSAAAESQ